MAITFIIILGLHLTCVLENIQEYNCYKDWGHPVKNTFNSYFNNLIVSFVKKKVQNWGLCCCYFSLSTFMVRDQNNVHKCIHKIRDINSYLPNHCVSFLQRKLSKCVPLH